MRELSRLILAVLPWILIGIYGQPSSAATTITVETTSENHLPREYNCEKVEFEQEQFVSCMCLTGVWAFYIRRGSGTGWRVLGFKERSCYHINAWIGEIRRVSNFAHQSMLQQFDTYEERFWVFSTQDWEAEVGGDELNPVKICLPGAPRGQYCVYNLRNVSHITQVAVGRKNFHKGCSSKSKEVPEEMCKNLSEYKTSNDANLMETACALIPPLSPNRITRFKRQDGGNVDPSDTTTAAPEDGQTGPGGDTTNGGNNTGATTPVPYVIEDEDVKETSSAGSNTTSKGNKSIMKSLTDWSKGEIAKRLKFDDTNALRKQMEKEAEAEQQTPAISMLKFCSDIAAQLCPAVPATTFAAAFNGFIKQQLTVLKMKEPHIPYPAFSRSLDALELCRAQATAFPFGGKKELKVGECESEQSATTSDKLVVNGKEVTLPPLPDDVKSLDSAHEPIVEIVWKSFLIGHSYCFQYFNRRFNDHHQFTVTMIKLFTNGIQDMWLLNKNGTGNTTSAPDEGAGGGPTDETGATGEPTTTATTESGNDGNGEKKDRRRSINPSTNQNSEEWYGGYLGKIPEVYKNLDNCYGASRTKPRQNPSYYYPWYLQRPPRDFEHEWFTVTSTSETPKIKRSASVDTVLDAALLEGIQFPPGPCHKKKKFVNFNYIDLNY